MAYNEQEQWLKIFDVPEAKFHPDGFTVYKIVSTVLYRPFPEASTSLEVWRRYSAILRLHKEVISLYNNLQLPESPPAYCKPSLIKRFDENEIESRRKYTLALLRYCAKYPSIFSSEQFTKFFQEDENAYKKKRKKKLSFGGAKEKKSASSLASSLGVSDGGLSLYVQLNESSSSSEELSYKASDKAISGIRKTAKNSSVAHGGCGSKKVVKGSEDHSAADCFISVPAPALEGSSTSGLLCLRNGQQNDGPPRALTSSWKREVLHPSDSLTSFEGSSSCAARGVFIHEVPVEESELEKPMRNRTAQYMERAGQLMARLSLKDVSFGQNRLKTCSDSSRKKLKSPLSYMRNYRVIGNSDRIIVALDVTTEETVAVKVIEKKSEGKSCELSLPVNIPFMVPVLRYHETEFAVYLVLKYVSGGKLWNHLKKFMKQPPPTSSAVSTTKPLQRSASIYEGYRLIEDTRELNTVEEDAMPSSRLPLVENDVSETEPLSLSFCSNFVIDECKSSTEHYSHFQSCDKLCHQSSFSNITEIRLKRDAQSEMKDSCQSSNLRNEQSASQPKSKSLDELNSVEPDSLCRHDSDVDGKCVWEPLDDPQSIGANENGSIGSNTLSGVSDDFSCSSFASHHNAEVSNVCNDESCSTKASSLSPPALEKEGRLVGVPYDVTNLIQNSKRLIEDVNKTLERSKRQIICAFSIAKTRDEKTTATSPVPESMVQEKTEAPNSRPCEKVVIDDCASLNENGSEDLKSFMKDVAETEPYLIAASQSPICREQEMKPLLERAPSPFASSSPTGAPRLHSGSNGPMAGDGCTMVSPSPPAVSSLLENLSPDLLERIPQVPEGLVRVWVSQVISAMDYLHKRNIIWGDFNPSNILLDEGGSILVTYKCSFGNGSYFLSHGSRPKDRDENEWLSCQGYFSPEMFSPVAAVTHASDWWSVGALLFHLLIGKDVASCHPCGITSHTQINFFHTQVSDEAASLITNLLCAHPRERLGSGSSGLQEIKGHPFFHGIEWPVGKT